MKIVQCIILFVLFTLDGYSQNYQCIQVGEKPYFINSSGYLRGMRIDSVVNDGINVIYYPYKTVRGNCSTHGPYTVGGCWLGNKIKQLPDGTFIFGNMYDDSIIVKTKAVPGDTWTFYSDTSQLYYKATVLSIDTMNVLGVLDSIKTILITACNLSGIVSSDPANGFQLILTKDHGFFQVFDLYTFPYHNSTGTYTPGTDYYYETCGSQLFNLVDFFNAPMKDIYNFLPGDLFESYFENDAPTSTYNGYFIDSIISKTPLSATVDSISLFRITWTRYVSASPYYQTIDSSVIYEKINSKPVFDTNKLPEENGEVKIYHYFPNNNSFCYVSNAYTIDSGILFNTFEPCGIGFEYKIGLGNKGYTACYDPTANSYYSYLTYARKNGTGCGSYTAIPLSVPDVTTHLDGINIGPNPVNNELNIFSKKDIEAITAYDIYGRIVYSQRFTGNNVSIDFSSFHAGIYLLKINDQIVRVIKE